MYHLSSDECCLPLVFTSTLCEQNAIRVKHNTCILWILQYGNARSVQMSELRERERKKKKPS